MIDISDSTYEAIMARDWKNAGWLFSEEMKAIHDGTPIPDNPQPCPDAISRQAAIDAMYKMHMNGKEGVLHDLKTETGSDAFFAETIADAVETLEELPPVNPQPNKEDIHREREQAYMRGYEDGSRKYRTEQSEDEE